LQIIKETEKSEFDTKLAKEKADKELLLKDLKMANDKSEYEAKLVKKQKELLMMSFFNSSFCSFASLASYLDLSKARK
jgi:hypothetical protein